MAINNPIGVAIKKLADQRYKKIKGKYKDKLKAYRVALKWASKEARKQLKSLSKGSRPPAKPKTTKSKIKSRVFKLARRMLETGEARNYSSALKKAWKKVNRVKG